MAEEDVPERASELEDENVEEIREAYPLMDAVARQEGWDDPEMDSYNVKRNGAPRSAALITRPFTRRVGPCGKGASVSRTPSGRMGISGCG
jgi:hypothetical protein